MNRVLSRIEADILIILIQLFSASSFLVTKLATREVPPNTFVFLRFLLGSITVLLIYRGIWRKMTLDLWKAALTIGAAVSFGTVCMTIGLTTTPAGQGAFIVSLSCLVVPFIEYLYSRHVPTKQTLLGLVVAVVGLAFLCLTEDLSITVGTLWLIASTVLFSIFNVSLAHAAPRFDVRALTAAQLFCASIFSLPLSIAIEGTPLNLTSSTWLCIGYIAVVVTGIRHVFQAWAQRHSTASNLALLFTLEPVIASIYGGVFLSESFTHREIVGCVLILIATLIAKFPFIQFGLGLKRRTKREEFKSQG